jgi:hypothetical protein
VPRTVPLLVAIWALSVPGQAHRPSFTDYPARASFSGSPAPPLLATIRVGHQFRTLLTRGARTGPNFAGAFTVVEWGCGSGCIEFAIADARSGTLYYADSLNGSIDLTYRRNSRLLVISRGYRVLAQGQSVADTTDFFEWTDSTLVRRDRAVRHYTCC